MATRVYLTLAIFLALSVTLCHASVGSYVCINHLTQAVLETGTYYNSEVAPIDFPVQMSGMYLPNMRCTYHLTVPTGYWTLIYFVYMQLEDNCQNDFIHITVPGQSSPENVCGEGLTTITDWYYISQDTYGQFLMQSNGALEYTGLLGYLGQLYPLRKRSPSMELEHISSIRRSAGAMALPSQMLDLNRFKTWVQRLQQVASDISLRAAKLEVAEEDEDADAAEDSEATRSKRAAEKKDKKEKGPITDIVPSKKIAAMRDLTCVSKFEKHCGEDTARNVVNLMGMCLEKLED